MSKHHVSHVHQRVMYDVRTMANEELKTQYDIDIDEESGVVWDNLEGKEFDNIQEWATYYASLEDEDIYGSFIKTGNHHSYDDD